MGFTTAASRRLILATAIAGLFGASAAPAFADMENLLDKLHEKGVLSDDDYNQMRTETRAERRAEALKDASDAEKAQKTKETSGSALKVPDALKSMELYGDLRLRYESRIARADSDAATSGSASAGAMPCVSACAATSATTSSTAFAWIPAPMAAPHG
jgi:hypothetical protein